VEQHKVLLIIVSVAIVLAAVVGVGLWLFYPRTADDAALAQNGTAESGGYEWQPLDYLQGQGDVPGLDEGDEPPADDLGGFEVTYGVIPGAETPVATDTPPMTGTPDQPAAAVGSAPASAGVEDSGSQAPAMTDTAGRTSGTAGPGVSPAADSGSRPVVASVPAVAAVSVVTGPDLADQAYWVQAIASPNRDTVEQSQITLREHQLGSRILTKVIDDRTYFRLRIGPFAVRAEAEKFLGWVQDINDFADAMIFVDYTTPVVAARPN
jgi:cell division septation protein DedD